MLSISCRPKRFSEVIGQDLAVRTLKSIARFQGMAVRSIVLQGAYGCGKTTLAKLFAKAVGCRRFKEEGDVCGECDYCQDVDRYNSPYYLELDASRVGNVDSIKSLIDRLSYVATDDRRVVVLDECHAASHAALTSLLKVLEEGIANTFFVFSTTEPLLKTIMSRSCVIPVVLVSSQLLSDYVVKIAGEHNIDITEEQVGELVLKSDGHVRDAMQLLDHFSMVGDAAIKTSYKLVERLVLAAIRNEDMEKLLAQLELYTLLDVNRSINLFIKNVFCGEGIFEKKLKDKGLALPIFNMLYQSEIREALHDEYGILLVFRYLKERFNENK